MNDKIIKEEIIEGFVRDQYGYCHYFVENKKAFIYNLYTYPEYRKKGHARNHIEYVIKEIIKTGYTGSIGIEADPRENSISVERLSLFYISMGLYVLETDKEEPLRCPSCHCIVDEKGKGHHSAADCIFLKIEDVKPTEWEPSRSKLMRNRRDEMNEKLLSDEYGIEDRKRIAEISKQLEKEIAEMDAEEIAICESYHAYLCAGCNGKHLAFPNREDTHVSAI